MLGIVCKSSRVYIKIYLFLKNQRLSEIFFFFPNSLFWWWFTRRQLPSTILKNTSLLTCINLKLLTNCIKSLCKSRNIVNWNSLYTALFKLTNRILSLLISYSEKKYDWRSWFELLKQNHKLFETVLFFLIKILSIIHHFEQHEPQITRHTLYISFICPFPLLTYYHLNA